MNTIKNNIEGGNGAAACFVKTRVGKRGGERGGEEKGEGREGKGGVLLVGVDEEDEGRVEEQHKECAQPVNITVKRGLWCVVCDGWWMCVMGGV